ncbi:MAG: archaellin/type IV pilin N-terminal domain-containing protein [Nitrososphaerota archaeon]
MYSLLTMIGRSKSGISPVVATVILVAVAIVIAIAVAFWASGLVGIFTRFEKLEIVSAYYQSDTGEGGVVLVVKNTGSADTVIDMIFVNGKPLDTGGYSCTPNTILTIGATATCTVSSGLMTGGVTNEIAVHTTGGKLYPTAVLVP